MTPLAEWAVVDWVRAGVCAVVVLVLIRAWVKAWRDPYA